MDFEFITLIILSIVFFLIYISSLILYAIYLPSLNIEDEVFIQLENDYKSSPIINLNKENCQDENSTNILGYFSGIPKGRTYTKQPLSYCSQNPFNFLIGSCKENPWLNYDVCTIINNVNQDSSTYIYYDKKYCKNVDEIKSRNYTKFNGCELCSINNKDNIKLNYDILIKNSTKTKEECLNQKGMKICGMLDELNQIVCLNENIECPLNDIIINNNRTHNEIINNTEIIYDTIPIEDKNYFIHHTNKNIDKQIISGFNISFGYPCSHLYPNVARNNLFIGYDFIYCNKSNKLSKEIWYQNSTDFFKENGIYELFQTFNISKLDNLNSRLFILFYPGFNKECYLKYSLNSNSFSDYMKMRKKFNIFFTFASIFSFGIVFYQLFSFFITRIYYTYSLIKSIIFIFFIIFFIFSKKYSKILVSPLNCLNDNTGDLKNYYNTYENNIKKSFIIQIINFIFCFIALFIEIFITFRLKKKEKESEKESEIEREKGIKSQLKEDTDSEMKINYVD